MRISLIIGLFFILVCNESCRNYIDGPNYAIEGYIYEINTHARIPDKDIIIREQIGSGGYGEVTTHCCAHTSATGTYSYTFKGYFKGDAAFIPLLTESMTVMWFYYPNTPTPRLEEGETVTWNLSCRTSGFLQVRFINSTPFDNNDLVSNIFIDRPDNYSQAIGENRNLALQGASIDTMLVTTYWGYEAHNVHYTVTRNSVATEYTTTLYTSATGTDEYYYEIQY